MDIGGTARVRCRACRPAIALPLTVRGAVSGSLRVGHACVDARAVKRGGAGDAALREWRWTASLVWAAPVGAGMASWQDAVEAAPGGARLLLDVTPGAKEACFPDGFEPWRKRIGMRVRAPAQEGEANVEVVRTIAAFFAHPTGRVHLESGVTDRRKAIRLMGLDREQALAALQPHFQERIA